MSDNSEKLTIKDIAKALNLSTTTISRALSGNGRVPEKTCQLVRKYCEQHNYVPSKIAQSLALSKTYNIGWIIPEKQNDLLFFQKSLMAICDIAMKNEYDIIPIMTRNGDDLSHIKRVVGNRKIDGVIISQPYIQDKRITYFKEIGLPMVVIGSVPDESIPQVDTDIYHATVEFMGMLLRRIDGKVAYISGDKELTVNERRGNGVREAEKVTGHCCIAKYYTNGNTTTHLVKKCVEEGVKLIVCADDDICMSVITSLRKNNLNYPDDIKLASLYAGDNLQDRVTNISSIKTDPHKTGTIAAKMLLDIIEGRETEKNVSIPYEVIFSSSTR